LVCCQNDSVLLEVENDENYCDTFSTSAGFGPEGAKSLRIEDGPRVLGAFPKTASGWRTMVVTAAVQKV